MVAVTSPTHPAADRTRLLDLVTAGQFRDTLAHAGADRDRLTIDLTAVDYVDSADTS